jgi:hypothetical protein
MSGDEGNPEEGGQRSEKKLALSGGISMKVGSYGKKKPQDKIMVIDLLFNYEGDPFPKIVGRINLPFRISCIFFFYFYSEVEKSIKQNKCIKV